MTLRKERQRSHEQEHWNQRNGRLSRGFDGLKRGVPARANPINKFARKLNLGVCVCVCGREAQTVPPDGSD